MTILTSALHAPRRTAGDLRRYMRARRDLAEGLQESRRSGTPPILVYQMGKVGSTTLQKGLQRAGYFTLHIHNLQARTTPFSRNWPPSHPHQVQQDFVRAKLLDGAPLKVVTGVRDPIARNVSALFQNLDRFGFDSKTLKTSDIPDLIALFFERFEAGMADRWFDLQLKECLGVDVFAHPFAGGYGILEDRHSVLILKAEASDTVKSEALERFVGQTFSLQRANIGARKSYAEVYKAFLDEIAFSDAYLASHYDTRYCRHFYSEEEIDGFREKWQRR